MSSKTIRLEDGTLLFAKMKPGAKLTKSDNDILAEFVEVCRKQASEDQRKRDAALLPGGDD